MSERIEQAANHVATRGLETAVQQVLEELTDEQRQTLARLGLTGETLLLDAVENIDFMTISTDIATRALSQVDVTAEADPVAAVIPLEVAEHPFVEQVRALVKQRLGEAA